MKPIRPRFKPLHILVVLVLLAIGFYFFYVIPHSMVPVTYNSPHPPEIYISDSSLAPPTEVSDSPMTYAHFLTIQQEEQTRKDRQRMADHGFGNQSGSFLIGTSDIAACDTCTGRNWIYSELETTRYYLSLPGYRLKKDETFHYRQGKYYLKYPVMDSPTRGHYAWKEVRYRLSDLNHADMQNNPWEGNVLIPVEKRTHDIVAAMVLVFNILLFTVLLYITIVLPGKILLNIARGEVFSLRNIRYLHIMGWTFLGVLLGIPPLRYLPAFFFRHYLTDDLHLIFWQSSDNTFLWFGATAVTFAIAKAFKRGYELQNEQELTV